MIRHKDRREHRPIAQSYRRILERRECFIIREDPFTVLNTQSHEIDNALIPAEPNRNPGRMTHAAIVGQALRLPSVKWLRPELPT
jgi:hypothetical protein